MKELGRIMRFDLDTIGGSQVVQLMSGLGILILLMGLFVIPAAMLYLTMMMPLLLISPLTSVAEKSGFNKLYGVLPVKRKNIARGRFLYIFTLCTLSELAGYLLAVLAFSLKLYSILPITSAEFREICRESFSFEQGMPLTFRVMFISAITVMLMMAVFNMVKMIHGSASAGIMGGIAASVLMVIVIAFFIMNSLDIMPVIELKGLFSLKNPLTAMSVVKCVIWHAAGFAVCMLCGEHTAKKLAEREL